MITKKLTEANKVTEKLVKFLKNREWDNSDELTNILDHANEEIEKIADQAIEDVLKRLEGSYSEEAKSWAANEMTGASGKPIKITKAEQRKAQTDFNRIQKAIGILREI
jgi:hypothetical protein